jgi:hypothetical protein
LQGVHDEVIRIGLVDLDGPEALRPGTRPILELQGDYRIVSAVAAGDQRGSFVPRIVNPSRDTPERFALEQNYPNPFNPSTEIAFDLPTKSRVTLNVYNINGRQVVTLVDQVLPAGHHSISWNGENASGSPAASGVYFYRLQAGEHVESRKMMLLK